MTDKSEWKTPSMEGKGKGDGHQGAVHKVRHAIFGQFLPPPLSHFVTHPGTLQKYVTHLGPPRFLVGLVQKKSRTKAPCTNYLSIIRKGFCSGGLSGGLLSRRFRPGWFLSVLILSEYICYDRKLNITLNFMFHMYDKKIYKCDVTCSLPPSPVKNCHAFSDPLPPSSVTYFMDGPLGFSQVRFMDITALPEL